MATQTAKPVDNEIARDDADLRAAQEYIATIAAEDAGTAFQKVRLIGGIKDDLLRIHPAGSPQAIKTFNSVEMLIFDARIKRAWYSEKESVVPTCSSRDGGKTGVLNPNYKGEPLIIRTGQVCASCPFNQFGSGMDSNGNRTGGKACKERRHLAAMLPDFDDPVIVSLAPTGLKAWDSYAGGLDVQRRVDPFSHYSAKLTRMRVTIKKVGANQVGVPEFEVARNLKPSEILISAKHRQEYHNILGALEIREEDHGEPEPPEEDTTPEWGKEDLGPTKGMDIED